MRIGEKIIIKQKKTFAIGIILNENVYEGELNYFVARTSLNGGAYMNFWVNSNKVILKEDYLTIFGNDFDKLFSMIISLNPELKALGKELFINLYQNEIFKKF